MLVRCCATLLAALLAPTASATASAEEPVEKERLVEEARALVLKRDFAKARPLLERAAALDAEDPAILSLLGRSQAATRQAALAIPNLRKALEKIPTDAPAAKALGGALRERGDLRGAGRALLLAGREGKDRDAALEAARIAPEGDPETIYEGFRLATALGVSLTADDCVRQANAAVGMKRYDAADALLDKALQPPGRLPRRPARRGAAISPASTSPTRSSW